MPPSTERNYESTDLVGEIYDIIKNIRDPEKPQTLEELQVIDECDITVTSVSECQIVRIELKPTMPHCSLATIIGLCVRVKLERFWDKQFKLDIYLKEGSHSSEHEVSKQINDKERIAAAMENPGLREIVEECIKDED